MTKVVKEKDDGYRRPGGRGRRGWGGRLNPQELAQAMTTGLRAPVAKKKKSR